MSGGSGSGEGVLGVDLGSIVSPLPSFFCRFKRKYRLKYVEKRAFREVT